jgi:polyisoprenoid-binding protein YceI
MKTTLFLVWLTGATMAAAGPWRVEQADVRVVCPMTVGGSFAAKTTALSGSVTPSTHHSPSFDGNLVVDLRTLDTGIGLRNEHLRERYLEVSKAPGYENAILSDIELKGVDPVAPEGKGTFTGSLALHGVKNTVAGSVEARKAGAGIRVKAMFPVNLADFHIDEPSYLGVGVKDTVQVEVAFTIAQ